MREGKYDIVTIHYFLRVVSCLPTMAAVPWNSLTTLLKGCLGTLQGPHDVTSKNLAMDTRWGKPLFEKWTVYMGIAQIVLTPLSQTAPWWGTFLDLISVHFFWHCRNELKSAQNILASILTPPKTKTVPLWTWSKSASKTARASVYVPPLPQTGSAFMKRPLFKKGLSCLNKLSRCLAIYLFNRVEWRT